MGRYGTHAYVLLGADSPRSIVGGEGARLRLHGYTGDPKDTYRAWLSLMNTVRDDRALVLPGSGRRVASCWDDHGEVNPIGKKPGLYMDLDLRSGRYLLSLYFLEIDWVQYRSHAVVLTDRDTKDVLAEALVSHFFQGKYQRTVLSGPRRITVAVRPETGPNAVCSGIFLDALSLLAAFPPWAPKSLDAGPEPVASDPIQHAEARAAAALADMTERPVDAGAAYLAAEAFLLRWLAVLERDRPAVFYRRVTDVGMRARERMERFVLLSLDGPSLRRAFEIQSCWARTLLDLPRLEAAARSVSLLDGPAQGGPAGTAAPPSEGETPSEEVAVFGEADPERRRSNARTLARRLLDRGDISRLAGVMERLLREDPGAFQSQDHYLYGCGLLYENRFGDAYRHFQKALDGDLPNEFLGWAFTNAAVCLVEMEQFERAAEVLRQHEARCGESSALRLASIRLAKALAAAGRTQEAREILDKVRSASGTGVQVRQAAEDMLKALPTDR